MYDSGYAAEKLAEEIENETNMTYPVTRQSYLNWINLCEQMLYSDIIREEAIDEVPYTEVLPLLDVRCDHPCMDAVHPDDVRGVYLSVDGKRHELEYITQEHYLRGLGGAYAYTKSGDTLRFRRPTANTDGTLLLLHTVRPAPKRLNAGKITGTILLPCEFVELVRCRLRGEKYRLMNEDSQCAKWINEYNSHLETFKEYIEARRAWL